MMRGFREALADKIVWILAFSHHIHTATSGFRNFFPTLLKTFGYGRTMTLVLTCPPYLLARILSILQALSSGIYNERPWHIIIFKNGAVAGLILACSTMNLGAGYFSMFVVTVGTYGVSPIIMAWVGSTCAQTKEKRVAAIAIINTFASVNMI
jgi:hypothetical protein